MNNSIKPKLFTLLGLLIAILAFSVVMYSQIPTIDDVKLTTSSFENEMTSEIEMNIPEGSSSSSFGAIPAYHQISDEITTERMLGKITKAMEDSCCQKAQVALATNIQNVCKNIVGRGQWTPQNMTQVKQSAQMAASLKFVDSGKKNKILKYVATVDKYFHALSICSSSHSYGGVDRANNIIASASSMRADASLQPCKSLIASLGQVKDNLYNAHLAYVRAVKAEEACNAIVSAASVYGRTSTQVEGDICTIRDHVNKVQTEKTKEKLDNKTKDVDENDW